MANISSSLTLEKSGSGTSPEPDAESAAPLTPERLARENRRHDVVLTGLVVLFGFLLASFPITNADIWMHLRVGQMIAGGEFQFGVDPFSYTTEGTLWVYPAWLCDLLFYGIYQLGGGAGLVLLRGLVVVGLMWLMFRTCRPKGSLLAALLCIGLAIATLSQRLLMRPEVMSYLFLGLTLYLLLHPPVQPRQPTLSKLVGLSHNRLWVFLPPLFLLWVNCDAWFFLGPITVALYLIGETLLQTMGRVTFRPEALSPVERKKLFLVLVAGLAVCVINPYHFRVFRVPDDLNSEAIKEIRSFETGAEIAIDVSPFEPRFFGPTRAIFRPMNLSIAQWCYYPLVLLGLVSFVLNLKQGSWSRFLIWGAFFLLSAWQYVNIGFFAVVAGPLTALNFQDWLAGRYGEVPSIQRRYVAAAQAARALVLLMLVTMIALLFYPYYDPELARPGREQALGLIHSRGPLGWSIFQEASWSQCAEQMHEWRQAGQLPGRAFYFNWQQQPSYAAWFDPPERLVDPQTKQSHWNGLAFMDRRFNLYSTNTIREFFDVYHKLRETGLSPQALRHPVLKEIFAKYDISHLVIDARTLGEVLDANDPTRSRKTTAPLVDLLLYDNDATTGKKKWELLRYVDGRTAILAWTESPRWPELEKLRYDPVSDAFHAPKQLPPADGVPLGSGSSSLAALMSGNVREPPLGADEARWHLQRAEQESYKQQLLGNIYESLTKAWEFPATGLSGMPPALGGWPYLRLAPRMLPLPELDATVEAEIWLAIRAARRALAERPEDGDAYYELFQAYTQWQRLGIERSLSPVRMNPMRHFQIMAALRAATLLKTTKASPWDLHLQLASRYAGQHLLDVTVHHYRIGVQAWLTQPFQGREPPTQAQLERLLGMMCQQYNLPPLETLEADLHKQQANFNLNVTTARNSVEAANMARDRGLADERRQYLEKALSEFTPTQPEYARAFENLMELYMQLGYLREPQVLLYSHPEAPAVLGIMKYGQYAIAVDAGLGNYKSAGEHLLVLDQFMKQTSLRQALDGLGYQTMLGDSFTGLQSVLGYDAPYQRGAPALGVQWVPERVGLWNQMGLIALESGQVQHAAELFRRAGQDFDEQSPFRPLSARYYQLLTGKPLETATPK
jgi:hypothetical protein